MTVLFFEFERLLRHAFPAYDIGLKDHLSIQDGFAKYDGDNQEYQYRDNMRQGFFQKGRIHK